MAFTNAIASLLLLRFASDRPDLASTQRTHAGAGVRPLTKVAK